jgi:hypothetical protein
VFDVVVSEDLEHAHSGPVEVQVTSIVVAVDLLSSVLNNLDSLDSKLRNFAVSVEIVEIASLRNGVALLRNLVAAGHVSVELMLSIELDLLVQSAVESKRAKDSLV